MTLELTLKADTFLDFAFGKVTRGKEAQVFTQYFPVISPVLAERGIQPLRAFVVMATNRPGVRPEQGSLTQMPSIESFAQFHKDPRFLEVKSLRDEAMELLADGHFFNAQEKVVSLTADTDYALIITDTSDDGPLKQEPLLALKAAADTPTQTYAGKTLTLQRWSQEAEQLINGPAGEALVFRIRFKPADS